MTEHPRDIMFTMDVTEDIGTYEPVYLKMRVQFRRDGSVTWISIPLEELNDRNWTYSTKDDTLVKGKKRSMF